MTLVLEFSLRFPAPKELTPAQVARVRERAQMIELHRQGIEAPVLAWLSDRHVATVCRCLRRRHQRPELTDLPRAGRPPAFDTGQRYRIISFYCQTPPLPGLRAWNLRTAAKHLEDLNILGCSPSHSTIQRILCSHALAPHRHKYFLQIRDPDFFPKLERILPFLLKPPEYFFLFDECPNLQALQRKDPPLPTTSGRPAYRGHDYTRHGTTDLLAFLQLKTGHVFGRCTDDHSTETLISVFTEHVRQQPNDAELVYLMDNLSPHFNDLFCQTVARLAKVKYLPLETGAQRRAWLQTQDKRIVVLFTPFHGSWLNPVEVWFSIFQPHALWNRDFLSVAQLIQTIEEFIDTWNTCFRHPFDWTYEGTGLHGKAVRRFTQFLLLEPPSMDSKFLADELLLMHNLARDYRERLPSEDWNSLRQCVEEKGHFLAQILQNEPGPKRRARLQDAISLFHHIDWS